MEFRSCNYCYKPAELICQRCRDWYCSRNCQHAHWTDHKQFCFPMPSLVKPLNGIQCEKSEADDDSRPTSPTTKFRNIKLSQESSKNGNSNRQLLENKENVPNPHDSVNINSALASYVASLDISSVCGKPEVKNSTKPVYYKTDKVDAASIRKPGTLSQVIPKVATVQPAKNLNVEPPKQINVEPPKQVNVEPPKQANVEPPKQANVEPPKQANVVPPKQANVEPPKQANVQPPKQTETVEPQKHIEVVEKIDTTPNVAAESKEPKIETPLQLNKTGPWMTPIPIEENKFVDVIVQYVAPDSTAWVSLVSLDAENNNLLRTINKSISATSTPSPTDVVMNALFLVPFEEIYYRAIVLEPVSAKGTVSVRLVDYGNQIDLPVGDLKLPLPGVSEKNAYAFPIKFRNPRTVNIANCIKIKKESIDNDIMTVVVEGEIPMTTMKDIDVAEIPIAANIDLICLDFSNLGSGYISACISDAKAVQFVEGMGPKMSKHCAETKEEYSPRVDELCLAQFDDGEWYRAVTLKVIDGNNFEIMFIDYGNITTVNRSAIRKMIDDFLHPCMMNVCFIKNFAKTPSKDDIQKTALYFHEHQAFKAETVEKDGDKYVIQVTI